MLWKVHTFSGGHIAFKWVAGLGACSACFAPDTWSDSAGDGELAASAQLRARGRTDRLPRLLASLPALRLPPSLCGPSALSACLPGIFALGILAPW